MAELLLKDEVYAIVSAVMEVYNQLGPGFLADLLCCDQVIVEIKAIDKLSEGNRIESRPINQFWFSWQA